MRNVRWAIGLSLAGILALGCGNADGRAGATEPTMPTAPGLEAPAGKAGLASEELGRPSRAELIGIASALNTAEIEAAVLARQTVTQPEVRELAAVIEEDHALALQAENRLARQLGIRPTAASPTIDRLQQQHSQAMDAMRAETGREIGAIYVERQIQLHQEADRLLDRQLIPAAEGTAELSRHLRSLQQTVRRHTRQLQDVQSRLEAVARD